MKVNQVLERDRNNLDLLRLLAALLVLFSHSFALTNRASEEPVARFMHHAIDGGGLAVNVFFVLSGFLIARSSEMRSPWQFVLARVLRIYPAYGVIIVLQTLLLGAVVSTLPAPTFLAHPSTWLALATGLVFSPRLGLPGAFEHNALPYQVNGSLWTLRVEVLCYFGALLTSFLRSGRVGVYLTCMAAAGVGSLLVSSDQLWLRSILVNVAFFLVGSLLWLLRSRVPLSGWAVIACAGALYAAAGSPIFQAISFVLLPYAVLYCGFAATLPAWLRPKRDLSYGAYLYAFPTQQCIALVLPDAGPYLMTLLAIGPVLLLAWASCRLVEVPALRLR